MRLQSRLFHALCRHVIGLHAHFRQLDVGNFVDVRMRKLVSPAIDRWPAENDVFFVYLIILVNILCALKPNKVGNASAITEMSHHPFLPRAHSKLFKAQNLAFELYERQVALQVDDAVDAASVNVFVRIILEQIAPCSDVGLFLQYRLTLGSNPR